MFSKISPATSEALARQFLSWTASQCPGQLLAAGFPWKSDAILFRMHQRARVGSVVCTGLAQVRAWVPSQHHRRHKKEGIGFLASVGFLGCCEAMSRRWRCPGHVSLVMWGCPVCVRMNQHPWFYPCQQLPPSVTRSSLQTQYMSLGRNPGAELVV